MFFNVFADTCFNFGCAIALLQKSTKENANKVKVEEVQFITKNVIMTLSSKNLNFYTKFHPKLVEKCENLELKA